MVRRREEFPASARVAGWRRETEEHEMTTVSVSVLGSPALIWVN